VILTTEDGTIKFESIIENITFKEENDEQTGHTERIIIESKDKTKIPSLVIETKDGPKYYNMPVGAHLAVEEKQKVKAGTILAKIPRVMSKARDITGGLPRVTELFEARNPLNPAVVAEIDGVVKFGTIKRGNREIMIEAKDGQVKKYLVKLSKHILVQDQDFVRSGTPLSDGTVTPLDILKIKGPFAVQQYLVNEVQEVYRLQGIKISDKHIEVIVRQMMSKVNIEDPGDTRLLQDSACDKFEFLRVNDDLFDKKVVINEGGSTTYKKGQIVSLRKLKEENSSLKRNDLALLEFRDAIPATASTMLQGITRASLGTNSWISAASFQETTKVLSTASIGAEEDNLMGLKENVIVGHKIPAGTGMRKGL
jgi:DNA-directed RNA polymerase subunit beta'